MRHIKGPIKQSGDVHPPELDDDMDDIDSPMSFSVQPQQTESAIDEAPARARQVRTAQPSLMPLLGMIAGGLLLVRLLR